MTKQEIDNLKVGDEIVRADIRKETFKIIEIFKSKVLGNLFIFNNNEYFWTEKELLKDFEIIKQQPKKIPYTLETFPENAIWFKNKEFGWQSIINLKIKEGKRTYLLIGEFRYYFDDKKDMEDYEIGCQVIKDGKIEIEWLPFYQEV